MANNVYHPDPYNGWSMLSKFGNHTAYEIMTDTSGRWQMSYNYGNVRVYTQRQQ